MLKATLETIAKIVGGNLVTISMKDKVVEGVSTDTRDIKVQNLFIPLVGEKFDGHNFVFDAIQKGAIATLWDKKHPTPYLDAGIIIVDDTLKAYQKLANSYLSATGAKVIGITGSNGKTGTKDILASILEEKFRVHKTAKNLNNDIGLPKTIMEMDLDDEAVVLEMGMDRFGDIRTLTNIAKPDIAVITNIGDSHIEFLKTRDNVFKAKTELLEFVNKENTFVCGDDVYLAKLDVNKIGFNEDNNFRIESYEFSDKGSKFTLDGKEYEMSLLGKHNISNTAIAIELAKKIGLSEEEIKEGLKDIKISGMRFQEIRVGEDIYINDAYNASPTSMKAAIDTLNEIYDDKYKIAILGDMLELGEDEVKYHVEVLNYLLDKKIKLIYLYGERMKKAYDIFMKNKSEEYRFWYYPTKEGIVESLKNIRMEKVILLKASRGTALEDIIVKE